MTSPARAHKQAVLAAKNADIDLSAAEPYISHKIAEHYQVLKVLPTKSQQNVK